MKIRTLLLAAVVLAATLGGADAAKLEPKTLVAWERYVAWTEHRMRTEQALPGRVLMIDALPAGEAEEARRMIRSGGIYTKKLRTTAEGRAVSVPKGLVHHWLGAVFIPGARVDELVEWLQAYDEHHRYFKDVEASRLLSRHGDDFSIFLRLRRTKVVTVHYNTEHFVRYTRHGDGRVTSVSYGTRIAELADAGTAAEYEKAAGDDRGFLWRLNSYWRYEQLPGGVVVELESVSLSRGVPSAVRWIVSRYLDSVPRESLEATLLPIRREAPRALVTRKDLGALGEPVERNR